MNVNYVFPTPIGHYDIDLATCKKFALVVQKYLLDSDDIVRHTDDNLHNKEEFGELISLIDYCVDKFCTNELAVDKADLKLTGMWANAHQTGSMHHLHQHPNSFLSGVLYLQIPLCLKEGNLIFTDPRTAKNMQYADFKRESCISNRSVRVQPSSGMLVLFPSWLEHGTELFVCDTKDLRISLSFNYAIKTCNYPTMKL